MRYLSSNGFKSAVAVFSFLLLSFGARSQKSLDWKNDTISKTEANGARSTYLNSIRGSGQKATERVNLPVDKLKEILDACAAKGVTEISVIIVSIRDRDIARYKRNHPGIADEQVKGTQLVVFRVPRRAFEGAMSSSSKVNVSNHPLMMTLAAAGLVAIHSKYTDLGDSADDALYFEIGTICPPPAACD